MAVNQTLKGSTNKIYSVITNFNEGIDKQTADDVASDASFKELINFYNKSEGVLSKRPAVYDSYLTDFIANIINKEYNSEKFNIITNNFGETKEVLMTRLQDFYDTILLGKKKSVSHIALGKYRTFKVDKIIGCQIIKNTKFLEALQDYKRILNGEYSEIVGTSFIEFSAILVAGGFSTEIVNEVEQDKLCGLYITRVKVTMDYDTGTGYTVNLEIDSVDPTISDSKKRRWIYYPEGYNFKPNTEDQFIKDVDEYIPLSPIDIANYNGYSYIATGKDYLIKIDQIPDNKAPYEKYPSESNIFQVIGGVDEENVYEPSALELTRVGLNILSNEPLDCYDREENAGNVDKVKGIFYSMDMDVNGEKFKQPITQLPYNKPFNIHIIKTGSSKPGDIEYREDNGETDPEKNKYEKLPGTWLDDTKTVFNCTGLNTDRKLELKVTVGEDVFLTFASTTSNAVPTTGYINEINDLVLSSNRIKIINNQLVLYGGHGYVFFSEYDIFNYFPNYYFIYVASEAGEETVTSINYFRQYHAIFTDKRIKKMVGTFGASDFGVYPLNDFVGCANGRTVRAVGSNLLFLGNDGIYKLKQGYVGEGTENVEKVDGVLGNELNLTNVIQAFVINSNYVVVKNDGKTWIIYNTESNAFFEYNLESATGQTYRAGEPDEDLTKKYLPFYGIFETNIYDTNGNFFIVPMYDYEYNYNYTKGDLKKVSFMTFRFADIPYISEDRKHKDGYGFISSLETHNMSMGYPTNTKKFKEIYIKMINKSGHIIPLYVTIYVDDRIVVDPENYIIKYDKFTNTYYYVLLTESNGELNASKAIGELTLGEDILGGKTVQQVKFRIGESGRSIKIKIRDGYNDTSVLGSDGIGVPERARNDYDFTITTLGIVYKVKKVKEG